MTGGYFSDEASLLAALDAVPADILMNDVNPIAMEILKKHIASDIYNAYTPKSGGWVGHTTYQRRHVLEGAVVGEMESSDTLCVTSTASPSPSILGTGFSGAGGGGFLQMLQVGNMGIWKSGFPRPAIANTELDYASNPSIQSAIKSGIARLFG